MNRNRKATPNDYPTLTQPQLDAIAAVIGEFLTAYMRRVPAFPIHQFSTRAPDEPLRIAQCDGLKHEWSDDYDDGDTCACGAFYLHARTGPGELPHIIATEQ